MSTGTDEDIKAIGKITRTLDALEDNERARVIAYIADREGYHITPKDEPEATATNGSGFVGTHLGGGSA